MHFFVTSTISLPVITQLSIAKYLPFLQLHVAGFEKKLKTYYVWRSKSCSFCFKQLPLNITQRFYGSCHLIDGERLLSVVVGVVNISVEKTLDFHDTTFSVSPSLFKV